MGGSVSCGQDNDELVDNLITSGFIRSKQVEQVFRAVDRADYILSSHRDSAYKDFAWKHGNIHLSSPCIYCEVMESLSLEPGLSFLNLGSGTGYFSTMAGLILTQSGINHGVELYEDCVQYSYDRLEEFKQKATALDEFDFCEPLFIQGNVLCLSPDRLYDRVYCGATCSEEYEDYIKQFVKVGGILVMPIRDQLFRYERVDKDNWNLKAILPVTFASLVIPTATEKTVHPPETTPLSLQELCRGMIRHRLRQNMWSEHKDLEYIKLLSVNSSWPKMGGLLGLYHIPFFEESDENLTDEEDEDRTTVVNFESHGIHTTFQILHDREVVDMITENVRSEGDGEIDSETEERNSNRSKSEEDITEPKVTSNTSNDGAEQSSIIIRTYSNMLESDSEHEVDLVQRKKIAKREDTQCESGHSNNVRENHEDVCSTSANASDLDDMECSEGSQAPSNSQRHKRNRSIKNNKQKQEDECEYEAGSKNVNFGHYTDTKAISFHMREKIQQLPLPCSLKLYINYHRNL